MRTPSRPSLHRLDWGARARSSRGASAPATLPPIGSTSGKPKAAANSTSTTNTLCPRRTSGSIRSAGDSRRRLCAPTATFVEPSRYDAGAAAQHARERDAAHWLGRSEESLPPNPLAPTRLAESRLVGMPPGHGTLTPMPDRGSSFAKREREAENEGLGSGPSRRRTIRYGSVSPLHLI